MRNEAVAGSFYPAAPSKLRSMIASMLDRAVADDDAARAVDTFIVVGPNHTGYGMPISVSADDWKTPLGVVKNDTELSSMLAEHDGISIDETAHALEHSVEVQLPFLQSVVSRPRCVFVCMGDQSIASSELLAGAIIDASNKLSRKVLVIASSDFNHYESAEVARAKDMPAIEALLGLDYRSFNKILREKDDTACGYGPITVAALFSISYGAKGAKLLKYSNSGEATGDYRSVVAYSSIMFL